MEYLLSNLPLLWSHWLWPILLFVFGLGLVVFVHELGHFLVAKAAGIKVERFALGFGPRLVGFCRAGTDYCLNLLPLGGYVKMLGQEDVKEAQETADPRAYQNKSVGARLAVVSAGVGMNVVLAAALFVLVAMVGRNYPAPIVGTVMPGFPASQAQIEWLEDSPAPDRTADTVPVGAAQVDREQGFRPGDRILNIEDSRSLLCLLSQPVTRFTDVMLVAALARPNGTYQFTLERRQDGRVRRGKARIGVKQLRDESQYAFGLVAAADTTFGTYDDLITDLPFREGDRLLAIDGQPVEHSWEIESLEHNLRGDPVKVTVLRRDHRVDVKLMPHLALRDNVLWLKDGSRLLGLPIDDEKDGQVDCLTPDGRTVTLSQEDIVGGVLREQVDILGMIPRLRVVGVWKGSPAQGAGIRPGDIVVGYGDRSAPTYRQFLEINRQYAGQGTSIVVLRGEETHKLWVVPKERNDTTLVGFVPTADLGQPVVAGVREGSPVAKAGIEPEAVIKAINDKPVHTWIDVYQVLKDLLGQEIRITYQIGTRQETVDLGLVDQRVFDPGDYKLSVFGADAAFRPLEVTIVERSPLRALVWGVKETCKLIVSTYVTLERMSQGAVSAKALSGPLGIGAVAIKAGRRGLIDFLYFLAFISASLAVFNFLPIPVTDGGHAMFLAIEKVRGKPLPSRVIHVAQVMGLVLLVAVFLALTWQDVGRLARSWW
jgi:regulator of sigma E protease